MEPLYQTDMVYTYEVYELYNKLIFAKRLRKLTIQLAILLPLLTIFLLLMQMLDLFFIAMVFTVAYPFALFFARKQAVKKTWQSNQIVQNQQIHNDFYADRVVQTSPMGTAVCPYDKLHNILENDRLICLMIANNQGLVIVKENCSEELIEFLRGLKKKS